MRASSFFTSCSLALVCFLFSFPATLNSGVPNGNQAPAGMSNRPAQTPAAKGPGVSKPLPVAGNRAVLEKEAALSIKEQELKKLSAALDARTKDLENARRSIEATLTTKKNADKEKYKKMIKLYKALRPQEAAKLLDKLDEELALEMLNNMDTKTAAKLIPLLNEKRVLKWTRLSLIND